MGWSEIISGLMGGQDENKPAVPNYQDPRLLADHMQRMQNYQPNGDEAMAEAQRAALRKQGEGMVSGSGIGGARNLSRMNNNGLDETGGDDASKADAFARIRAMLGGG
jgi:hypothetical protein